MRKQQETPTIAVLTVIGIEQQAMKSALGVEESDRVAGGGLLWYEKVVPTKYSGPVRVQLHAQGEAGNTVSAADATRIIGGGVRFMLLCGIAAGYREKVKIGDVVVPRAVIDATVKVAEGGEHRPRPTINSPLKGVLQMNAAARVEEGEWHDLFNQLSARDKPVPQSGQEEEFTRHVAQLPALHESAILSDNLLLRDPDVLIDAANDLHQQTRAGEMEAAGFVKACTNPYPPIPWYVMRGISDFGDTFKNDRFHALAAYAVAAYAALYIRDVLDLRIWGYVPSSVTPGTPSRPFREESTFNILLLPFDPLENLPAKEIKPERAILKRLSDMRHEQKLSVQVALIEDEFLPVSFEHGVELGRRYGANLVIWGDYYQSVGRNATELALRWALVDPPFLANLPSTGKTPVEAVESLSLLTRGHLQGDIDFVLFWSLSYLEMAAARYQNALAHLETVVVRFGDRFPSTISYRTDHRGFSMTVKRTEVQLIYYMGHCYQKLGQLEKAIACWDAILIISGGQKGGNVFAGDMLGLAIGMGESAEVVRGLLHVLLRKAIAQLEFRGFQAATKTFQQVYRYAKMAKDNPTLSGPIFNPVIAWIRDDLKIPEDEAGVGAMTEAMFEALRKAFL